MPEQNYISRELALIQTFLEDRMNRHTKDIASLDAALYTEPNGMAYRVRELERSVRQWYKALAWVSGIAAALLIAFILFFVSETSKMYHAYEKVAPLIEQLDKGKKQP